MRMNDDTKNALNTAIKTLNNSTKKRISLIPDLGHELYLISLKESKQPSATRGALEELWKRMQKFKKEKVFL